MSKLPEAPYDEQLEASLLRRTGLSWSRRGRARQELIERAWKRAGAASLEAYAADVAAGQISLSTLIDEVRVPESYLFRDPAQLEAVSTRLRAAAAEGRTLRIWSAGCSSGEEAYTLAILAAEERASVEILGTDLSESAIAKARAGIYTTWSLRGPAKHRAMPFLIASEGRLRVAVPPFARVSFRTQNLVEDAASKPGDGGRWDVVLCRNVLIYFGQETRQRVVEKLAEAVVDGGLLIFGPSDAPPVLPSMEPIVTDEAIVYRKRAAGEAVSEPSARGRADNLPGLVGNAGRDRTSTRPTKPLRKGAPTSARSGAKARAARGFVVAPPSARPESSPVPKPPGSSTELRTGLVPKQPAQPLLDGLGTVEDVLEIASRLETSNPEDPRAECLKGLAALELGATDAAHEAFRRALYLDPNLLVAHAAMASIHEQRGDREAALFSYRRIVALAGAQSAAAEVPLAKGTTVSDLTSHAERQIAMLSARRSSRTR